MKNKITVLSIFFALMAKNTFSQLPYMVKDIYPGSGNSIETVFANFINSSGILYFYADNGTNGFELWKTDGTDNGTAMVKDIAPGMSGCCYSSNYYSDKKEMIYVNGFVYFYANNGTYGSELWKTDGTANGTVMVRDIYPGSSSSCLPSDVCFAELNGIVYFMANDSAGFNLWKSDGTMTGTVIVKNFGFSGFYPAYLTNINGTIYFTGYDLNGMELWKTDGTTVGTVMVKDIDLNPGSSGLYTNPYFTNLNGIVFFIANNGINGDELWKSDGTDAGTVMVKDIKNIYPNLTNVNGTLYFSANDGFNGEELWKSDGTDAGTVMVKDIAQGSSSPRFLTTVNNTLYFSATGQLWRSDGTDGGTIKVSTIYYTPYFLTNVNGALFFRGNDGATGNELWVLNTSATGVEQFYETEKEDVNIFPNPFTDHTFLTYSLEKNSVVSAQLYNIIGEKVAVVLNQQNKTAGSYQLNLSSEQLKLHEGIYLVKLNIDGKVTTKKVLLVR